MEPMSLLVGVLIFVIGVALGYKSKDFSNSEDKQPEEDKYEKYRNPDGLLSRKVVKGTNIPNLPRRGK